MSVQRRWAWGMAAAALAGLAYSRLEAEWFALRRCRVPPDEVGDRGLTILHLSDLHFSDDARSCRMAEWIGRLASLVPDLVIVTGDNLARPDGLPLLLGALEPFAGRPGAFVFGSNDYFAAGPSNPAAYLVDRIVGRRPPKPDPQAVFAREPDLPWQELRDGLTSLGWHYLDNARARVEAGGRQVELVGLADPHIGLDEMPPPLKAASSAIGRAAGMGERAGVLRVGVVHAPYARALTALACDGASLILAGHTHGGQLAIPGAGAIVSNCDLPPKMARGLHRWPGSHGGLGSEGGLDGVWLHVSAGLGTSPFAPVRFACRPEATLLAVGGSGGEGGHPSGGTRVS